MPAFAGMTIFSQPPFAKGAGRRPGDFLYKRVTEEFCTSQFSKEIICRNGERVVFLSFKKKVIQLSDSRENILPPTLYLTALCVGNVLAVEFDQKTVLQEGPMDKVKRILAPTDFSELSRAGVEYALMLGRELGAVVTVYRVVSSEDLVGYTHDLSEHYATVTAASANIMELHERALDRFLETYVSDPSVTIHRRVELGSPADNIVGLALKDNTDLIVMSTHGRSGLYHALYGSVTEKVVRHAPCPVLSINPRLWKGAMRIAA